jgi:hypothetical protein
MYFNMLSDVFFANPAVEQGNQSNQFGFTPVYHAGSKKSPLIKELGIPEIWIIKNQNLVRMLLVFIFSRNSKM